MTSKITLYSDKNLIEQIKIYAKEHNTSVSKIVNEFFANLLNAHQDNQGNHKITDNLTGRLKGKNILLDDYGDYLADKYL